MRRTFLAGILITLTLNVTAQSDTATVAPAQAPISEIGTSDSANVAPTPVVERKIEAKSTEMNASRAMSEKNRTIMKPMLGLGFGIINYVGDVSHNEWTNPLVDNFGANFNVIQNLSPSFGLEFNFMYGRITANERDRELGRYLNFRTEVFQASIGGTYNFAALLPAKRRLNPFIGVGISAFNFTPKGDLRDKNGYTYHYWNDGTTRSIEQGAENSGGALILKRDHVYESDLRQANTDGLGKYTLFSFAIPVTAGIEFRVSNRSLMRLSTTLTYAFTDLLDNVSNKGEGIRKGNSANDMFFYTNLSYHFDFFTPKKKETSRYDEVAFPDLVKDEDGDGVENELDQCPDGPFGASVNEFGCPLDSDTDGVPDTFDDEMQTAAGLNVDKKGVAITDQNVSARDTSALKRDIMYDVLTDHRKMYKPGMPAPDRSEKEIYTGADRTVPLLAERIGRFDGDKNGSISVEEVYDAIDKFFDKEIEVTIAEINELIDHFFDQE